MSDMSGKKLFTDKRWTEPPAVEVTGNKPLTEEEKNIADEWQRRIEKNGSKKITPHTERSDENGEC